MWNYFRGMEKTKNNKTLEDKIDRYIKGQLNDEDIEQLWVDVIQDSYYFDYMKTAANVHHLELGEEKANVHEFKPSSKIKYYWVAAAASIAILIGVLSVVFQSNVSNNPLMPVNELALQNVRSVEVLNNDPQSQIKKGINLANNGEISQALSLLQKVDNENKKASIKASANLNIGIINYNHKNYNVALNAFNKVIPLTTDNILMQEKAYWFAGNAYLQLGDLQKARTAIRNAYNLDGAYRRIAGKYLKQLNEKLSD